MDFYTIETGLNCGPSSVDIVIDSIVNVFLGHRFRNNRRGSGPVPSEMGCTTLENNCGRRERLSSTQVRGMSSPPTLKLYYQYIDAAGGGFPQNLHSKSGRRYIHPLHEQHPSPFSRHASAPECRFQVRQRSFLTKMDYLALVARNKKKEYRVTYYDGGLCSLADEQTTIRSSLGVVFSYHISRDVLEAAGSCQRCHYDAVLQGNVADPQRREKLGMSLIDNRHFDEMC